MSVWYPRARTSCSGGGRGRRRCAFLSALRAQRDPHAEDGPIRSRLDGDRATVPVLDDAPRGVETEPVPLPTSLVVKNASKARAATSGGIPGPVSAISTTTAS